MKVQETSTPISSVRYREREEIFVDLTPIKRSPIFDLNGTVDAINVSSEPSQNITLEHTGMSPVLKKMLITPVKEDEIMEMKRILSETINLTRAAIEKGVIERRNSAPDLDILEQDKLENNYFYRCCKSRSMSLTEMLLELNIDAWELDDFYLEWGLEPRQRGGNKQQGVLRIGDDLNRQQQVEEEFIVGVLPTLSDKLNKHQLEEDTGMKGIEEECIIGDYYLLEQIHRWEACRNITPN